MNLPNPSVGIVVLTWNDWKNTIELLEIFKTQPEHLGVLKSFLIFLNMIRYDELKNIDQDDHVFDVLRKI